MTRVMLGKAQLPSEEHPMGVAVCGTPVTPGLIVWTNECRVGKVTDQIRSDPEWFDVEYPDGRRVMQNGERVATVFEGKAAANEWPAGWEETPDPGTQRVVVAITIPDDVDPFDVPPAVQEALDDFGNLPVIGEVLGWVSGEAFVDYWKKGKA